MGCEEIQACVIALLVSLEPVRVGWQDSRWGVRLLVNMHPDWYTIAQRNSSAEAESARLALESASQLAEEQGARLEATESALAASRHELQVPLPRTVNTFTISLY